MDSNNSIAICVMTHNHPKIIYKVYKEVLGLYSEYGIDVYLYDSSETDETYNVYRKLLDEFNCSNLFYVAVKDVWNEKISLCLQGYGHVKAYEYILPIKDRLGLRDITTKSIADSIKDDSDGFDAIILDLDLRELYLDFEDKIDVYDDPALLFRNKSVALTDWGRCIFGRRLLEYTEWNYVSEHYHFEDKEWDFQSFRQSCILFDTLARKENTRVKIISYNDVRFFMPIATTSGWTKCMTRVWFRTWPNTINLFPSVYDEYKKYAMKTQTDLPLLLGEADNLYNHLRSGRLSKNDLEFIKCNWFDYTDMPIEVVDMAIKQDREGMAKCIYERFQNALKQDNPQEAYNMNRYGINLFRDYFGREFCYAITDAFEIYREEFQQGIEEHFLKDIRDAESLYSKYSLLKRYYRRIYYDIRSDLSGEYVYYINQSHLSDIAKKYIIQHAVSLRLDDNGGKNECLHSDMG